MAERHIRPITIAFAPIIGTLVFAWTNGPINERDWADVVGFVKWLPVWSLVLVVVAKIWPPLRALLVGDREFEEPDEPADTLAYAYAVIFGASIGAMIDLQINFSIFNLAERSSLRVIALVLFAVIPVLLLRQIPERLYRRSTRWLLFGSRHTSRELQDGQPFRKVHYLTVVLSPVLGSTGFSLTFGAWERLTLFDVGRFAVGFAVSVAMLLWLVQLKWPLFGRRFSSAKPREWRGRYDVGVLSLSVVFGLFAGIVFDPSFVIPAADQDPSMIFLLSAMLLVVVLPLIVVLTIPEAVYSCWFRSRPPSIHVQWRPFDSHRR